MRRRQEDKPEVPQWVLTYGDMMSLLLCFFILLAAFSELKQEREYLDVITSIKQAFGYEAGVGRSPTQDPPENSVIELMEELNLRSKESAADRHSPNVHNRSTTTTYLTEGVRFIIGGAISFAPASYELSDSAREILRDAADRIRGTRTKVEIRGHAHGYEDTTGGLDLYDLSYRRAKSALDFLVNECNVSPLILVPVGVADHEPAEPDPFVAATGAESRRVQIIQTEIHVDELNRDAYGTGRERPGLADVPDN